MNRSTAIRITGLALAGFVAIIPAAAQVLKGSINPRTSGASATCNSAGCSPATAYHRLLGRYTSCVCSS
jgi:hypothetical protein